jgi:hypothetical protein
MISLMQRIVSVASVALNITRSLLRNASRMSNSVLSPPTIPSCAISVHMMTGPPHHIHIRDKKKAMDGAPAERRPVRPWKYRFKQPPPREAALGFVKGRSTVMEQALPCLQPPEWRTFSFATNIPKEQLTDNFLKAATIVWDNRHTQEPTTNTGNLFRGVEHQLEKKKLRVRAARNERANGSRRAHNLLLCLL